MDLGIDLRLDPGAHQCLYLPGFVPESDSVHGFHARILVSVGQEGAGRVASIGLVAILGLRYPFRGYLCAAAPPVDSGLDHSAGNIACTRVGVDYRRDLLFGPANTLSDGMAAHAFRGCQLSCGIALLSDGSNPVDRAGSRLLPCKVLGCAAAVPHDRMG